jgi:hypothetical protein
MLNVEEILGVKIYTNNGDYIIGSDAIETLYFIEDIYSTSIMGKIKFIDTIGLLEFGPINGNERFEIKFGNTENDKYYNTINLYGYKIKSIIPSSNTSVTTGSFIEMILVDDTFAKFHNRNWSKAWVDSYIHDIVEDIATNHVGVSFKQIEKTKEKISQFDTHLKTPAEGIQWLSERCSSSVHGQAGHLLYPFNDPDSTGYKYNFVSLETLLRQTKLMDPVGDRNLYVFSDRNEQYQNKILNYSMSHVDYATLRTLAGAVYHGFDINRKKLLKREFTYKEAVSRFTILGKKTLFTNTITPDHHMTKIETYGNENMIDNLWFSRWIKQYCLQQTITLSVAGSEKRHAGGMIKIEWPSTDSVQGIINKQMNGKYLIKSVTHYFSKDFMPAYQQKLVCIKNGYQDSDNSTLIKSVNTNI